MRAHGEAPGTASQTEGMASNSSELISKESGMKTGTHQTRLTGFQVYT